MKNIVLIGMPGCGKSTLGVLLAKSLGYEFIDTDLIIQKNTGRLLHEIVEEDGKEAFLDIERDAILTLSNPERTVVATGGSAVLRDEAIKHLKDSGVIVYLSLPYATVSKRIRNIKTRGIAFAKGETLKDIYNQRLPYYEKYADIKLRCDFGTVEKNVTKLVGLLKRKGYIQ
ncbi:MAG: shikimate kinase [Clostridia bacterium]|nr:shikimate kinase [Clostridia bacterium]